MSLNKSNLKILAIESSCDETAASVVEKNGNNIRILSNVVASQISIHQKYGGVFPEMASRAHTEKIIEVVEEALEKANEMFLNEGRLSDGSFCERSLSEAKQKGTNRLARKTVSEKISHGLLNNIDLVAVTTGPGLIGSLLIGVNFAKTLSFITKKPIIGVNHLLGHIYSNFDSEGKETSLNEGRLSDGSFCERSLSEAKQKGTNRLARKTVSEKRSLSPRFPALILIVSGGHTSLVLMKNHNDITTLGETLDDAAGEAFDKVAKLLQLGYPGGPVISKAAAKFQSSNVKCQIKLPRPMLNSPDYNFSFSGLKTAVLHIVKNPPNNPNLPNFPNIIAAEFQQAVIDVLIAKTLKSAKEFKPKSICLCGGVSANKELRRQMAESVQNNFPASTFHCPPSNLSTDNATMIGIAAAYHTDQKTTFNNISANANLKL